MRQGQQNRRGRGRSNNNRKGQSPLTRSFESNGPDVKIRGTPAHIGEKYMSLARDAAASGDPVLAENYLQHAEHYNRIIMAAREQFAQGGDTMNGAGRHRQNGDSFDGNEDWGDDEGDDFGADIPPAPRQHDPQPRMAEGNTRQEGHQRQDDRPYRRGGEYNRPQREQRDQRERHGVVEPRSYAPPRPAQAERPEPAPHAASGPEKPAESFAPAPRSDPPPRRRERYQPPEHEQPEFLRRPVRRPRREANGADTEGGNEKRPEVPADDEDRD